MGCLPRTRLADRCTHGNSTLNLLHDLLHALLPDVRRKTGQDPPLTRHAEHWNGAVPSVCSVGHDSSEERLGLWIQGRRPENRASTSGRTDGPEVRERLTPSCYG